MYHCGAVRIDALCEVDHANNRCSGIYVPDDERWPARFRGIGIRIEDSVCVGDDSPIVLTTEAVKEVSIIPVEKRHVTVVVVTNYWAD